ncbi:MAG: DUF362 domain-containing protein [Acidimicrobiia bacterium]|nr:DUF362 domain-containing protein [Acidimicrobiia bacterium]
MKTQLTRRVLLPAAAGALASCARAPEPPRQPSPIAVLKAQGYATDLLPLLRRGAQECGLDARGKRVLLKPNLVEFDHKTCINTHPAVLAATVELFRSLGAADVRIGEGPGHRRDTLFLAEEAGYMEAVPRFESLFVDLNRDDVSRRPGFLHDDSIYLPNTALQADLIVSLPKMKTHHWAGATLSMKNYFGLVPGAVYGWPKNPLHYAGIDRSIVGLSRIFRRNFAIVDGIIGMEGNGPIQGTPKSSNVIVMGADLVAVDATCCRIMGIDPTKVNYLGQASDLGNLDESQIPQRGERIDAVHQRFQLIDQFSHLRLG